MKIYSADLETVVYEGQTSTEAWASALVALDSDEPLVFHSLRDTLAYLDTQDDDAVLYYHNLKFDGNFWLSFLITELGFKQGYTECDGVIRFKDRKELRNNELIYLISSMGQWYTVTFKYNNHTYTLKDSLKLLPFKLKEIGQAFKTKHQKLDMEYEGERYSGCEITPQELEYIKNDVLVLKEALNIMFEDGHNKLTIGSCCLAEYKKMIGSYDWGIFFPRLDTIDLDVNEYGSSNADEYIRKSYHGGWCYLVKGASGKRYNNGTTADVNSLYPSMMHSMSGNYYPVGKPIFWKGSEIPKQALRHNRYYFIRIRCRFYLKHGKLPFIQIKNDHRYRATEMLETSDVYNRKDGKYYSQYYDRDGNLHNTIVELTLTKTDYILLREHYDLYDFEILDGCWFFAEKGIFDNYIDKYANIKKNNKGAKRTEAKLFLNNLYGKMATSLVSSFKYAIEQSDGSLAYKVVSETNKDPVYIPVGSAITSYSRNFTIRAAQANFYGVDKRGFKYADTDSIHCDLQPNEIKGIKVSDTEFCCWKLESCWDDAKFIRQKTYVEHVTHEDLKPINNTYYNIKCAGMPESCKDLLLASMGEEWKSNKEKVELTDKQKEKYKEFLSTKRSLDDFKIGLRIPSKLLPRVIKGGVVLTETEFTMREFYL